MSNTSQIRRSASKSNYTRRTYPNSFMREQNLDIAERADLLMLSLMTENSLLHGFKHKRNYDIKHNENTWDQSIKEFVKYHQPNQLTKEQKSFLNEFKNFETIEERIKSNRVAIQHAVELSNGIRLVEVPEGGKKYRKHKSSKHKSSKHKSSKHKSSKHKSSKHKSSKHKSSKHKSSKHKSKKSQQRRF